MIPGILAVSVILSLVWYVNREEETWEPYESQVKVSGIFDNLQKLQTYIGPRGWETEEERKNLRSVTAMIDGWLGPENLGYEVERSRGIERAGRLWPVLAIQRGGQENQSLVGISQGDEGAGLAVAFALAELEGHFEGENGVALIFYPPGLEWGATLAELGWEKKEGPVVKVRQEGAQILVEGLETAPRGWEKVEGDLVTLRFSSEAPLVVAREIREGLETLAKAVVRVPQ